VSVHELVAGDIVLLDQGDVVPTDGLFVAGFQLLCDESALTGESDALKKGPGKDMFMLAGAKVVDGTGSMLVTGVGINSINGKTIMSLQEEPEDTPLQKKLGDLAEGIGKIGLSAAVILLVLLIMIYFITRAIEINRGEDKNCPNATAPVNATARSVVRFFRRAGATNVKKACATGAEIGDAVILFVLQAITIVVVAVPEGLPMAVTMALAYATIRMLKDNNFVRVLAACETMGNATSTFMFSFVSLPQSFLPPACAWLLTFLLRLYIFYSDLL
jgi:Ca2+-transporting ATPase